jgi:hypothetical protein
LKGKKEKNVRVERMKIRHFKKEEVVMEYRRADKRTKVT